MFGSENLDVAIGLMVVFFLLSLVASAVREWFEGIVKSRAVDLERGIRMVLDDPEGTGLAKQFYEHPLIAALYQGDFDPQSRRLLGRGLPTYVPARSFVDALLDLTLYGPVNSPYAASRASGGLSISELRSASQRVPSAHVRRALIVAIDSAQGDLDRARANLESWFNSAMDRVSGWYKRRTQLWLFGIGLVTALMLNVNAFTIAQHLLKDKAARELITRTADAITHDTTYLRLARDGTAGANTPQYKDLAALELPIGWSRAPKAPSATASAAEKGDYWLQQFVGLLVTALAVMLGAPFWFDLLNKVMTMRSTVKPKEVAPIGGGSMPPIPASTEAAVGLQHESAEPSPSGASNGGTAASSGTSASAPPRSTGRPAPPFTPQEWADGAPDEGIL